MPLYTKVMMSGGDGEMKTTLPESGWKVYHRTARIDAFQMDIPFRCQHDDGSWSEGVAGDYLIMHLSGECRAIEQDIFESLWTEAEGND